MIKANEIEVMLRRAHLPYIENLDVSVEQDSTGDEAAYVYLQVSDEEASSADFDHHSALVTDRIFSLFRDANIPYWPYVWFRTVSAPALIH